MRTCGRGAQATYIMRRDELTDTPPGEGCGQRENRYLTSYKSAKHTSINRWESSLGTRRASRGGDRKVRGNRWRKGDNEGEGDAAAQQPMRHGDRDAVYCTCHVTRPHCGQVNHRANAGTADLGLPVGVPGGSTPHGAAADVNGGSDKGDEEMRTCGRGAQATYIIRRSEKNAI